MIIILGVNATHEDDTIVNVPLDVNVWIVCPPLVVIVPQVEVFDTQSLQFVAYDIITTQLQPGADALTVYIPHHPPQPRLAGGVGAGVQFIQPVQPQSVPVPAVPPLLLHPPPHP